MFMNKERDTCPEKSGPAGMGPDGTCIAVMVEIDTDTAEFAWHK